MRIFPTFGPYDLFGHCAIFSHFQKNGLTTINKHISDAMDEYRDGITPKGAVGQFNADPARGSLQNAHCLPLPTSFEIHKCKCRTQ
jgi:hypothetical protein